jgi:hypothetical protein
MAWNLPVYDTDNITFGPAVIYIGEVGSTPTTDIGAVRGNTEITVAKEVLEIKQGSPQVIIKQYVMAQSARISFSSIEAMGKLSILQAAFGAGEYAGTPGTGVETLGYGGDVNLDEKSILVRHVLPNGATLDWCFWRAQGKADTSAPFNETGETVVPMEFEVLDGLTDWAGSAIANSSKSRLFRIIKTNPPA